MTDPDNHPDLAGKWAARAREAAQQQGAALTQPADIALSASNPEPAKRRRFSKPSSAAAPAPAARVNPLLPSSPRNVSSAAADLDDFDEEVDEGGLSAIGFGYVAGPTEPPLAPVPLNPALPVPSVWPTGHPVSGPGAIAVQLVGLHGGAGTSTLAALLGPQASDCGVGLDKLITTDVPVLFVTRTHAHGLDLALRIGQQYAARILDPVMILGIVVVHDAPHLSKGLARTLRSVQRTLPNCWTVPWDEDWRHEVTLPPVAGRGRIARDTRRILRKAIALRETRTIPLQTRTQHQ